MEYAADSVAPVDVPKNIPTFFANKVVVVLLEELTRGVLLELKPW